MTPPRSWSEGDREWWEERAAILEYDAGMTRDEAENEAFLLMLTPNPMREIGMDYEPANGGEFRPADWITDDDLQATRPAQNPRSPAPTPPTPHNGPWRLQR